MCFYEKKKKKDRCTLILQNSLALYFTHWKSGDLYDNHDYPIAIKAQKEAYFQYVPVISEEVAFMGWGKESWVHTAFIDAQNWNQF